MNNSSDTSEAKTNPTALQLPCRYLRCKEMYYQAPDDDEFAGGAYWCERTQEPFGPDREVCGKKQCCASRTCYVT